MARPTTGGTRTIEIDDEYLAAAQQALGTATRKDTVNAAHREVTALAARRRDLQRLTSGGLPDLEDQGVQITGQPAQWVLPRGTVP